MVTKPLVIMPFVIIAFLECVVLEFIYFSTRSPISYVANPIVHKFSGEGYLHYPGNLVILPRLFYYGQVVIYVLFGAFLTAVSVNIYKNITAGLPIKVKALVRNALSRYFSFFAYAILVTALFFLLRNVELYIFSKVFNKIARLLPFSISSAYRTLTILLVFITNLIFQALFISTIPLIALEKMNFFKALVKSFYVGVSRFFSIFILISLPFFIYLPVVFIKGFSTDVMAKTFPEMNLLISVVGIILAMFLDCFSLMCVSRFLLEWHKNEKVKTV